MANGIEKENEYKYASSYTLHQLVDTYESYDKLRSDGIKFNEPEVVAMCDRRMDLLQDRIIEVKESMPF
jgi:hypothetical protein